MSCRAQHLYMLAFNVQLSAFQLMQLCHKFELPLGDVVLNCSNHHVGKDQDPLGVIGNPIPSLSRPDETERLEDSIKKCCQKVLSLSAAISRTQ